MSTTHKCYKRLGERISRLRLARNLTQLQLSARVGLCRGSIANIEIGRQAVMLHDVPKFAKALRVEPDFLTENLFCR